MIHGMIMVGIFIMEIILIINGGNLKHGNIIEKPDISNMYILYFIVFIYFPTKLLLFLITKLKTKNKKPKLNIFIYDLVPSPGFGNALLE